MKKEWLIAGSLAMITGLAGCGVADNNAADDNNGRNQSAETNRIRTAGDDNGARNLRVNRSNQNNQRLSISEKAERSVEKLGNVDDAHVIIRNNDAYVAVRMGNGNNDNNNQTHNKGGVNNAGGNTAGTGNISRNDDGRITGNNNGNDRAGTAGDAGITGNGTGAGYGVGNGTTTDDAGADRGEIMGGNGDTNSRGNNIYNNFNTGGVDNDSPADMSGKSGNNGGKGRNGAGTAGNNGQNYSKVSTKSEQQIADQVRKADKNINEVYVSFDTNFYNTMSGYSDDIRNGRNRDGIFNDFTDTMRSMFNLR